MIPTADGDGASVADTRILYLAPDTQHPSWGVGMLYEHVRLLRSAGFDAWVLHRQAPFRIDWFSSTAPVLYLDTDQGQPRPRDLLVVPEVDAATEASRGWPCRRGVFAQGPYLLLKGQQTVRSYSELGYTFALAVLPNVAELITRYLGLEAIVVPPFVAPYFSSASRGLGIQRSRTILLVVKEDYRNIGFPDYQIFRGLLQRNLPEGWALRELKGLTHREAAEAMGDAAFLVNLNSHEAFNTTVPEAMASGCLALCYEAYGGKDFLQDGRNAFVFPNHYVFPLLEKLLSLIQQFDAGDEQVAMRSAASVTMAGFTSDRTRQALMEAFAPLVNSLDRSN